MTDYGAKFAEKKIRKVDRQLQAVYRQAEKELEERLADFVRKSKAQNEYKQKQLAAGLITDEEYQSWMKGQVFQKERWERKIKQVQKIMHDHNITAAKIIHENKLDVYTENYLRNAFDLQGISGISFELYNEQAVASLIRDREQILPEWNIDEEKDYNWNYRKVNNAVTQGIIQGQSVEQIMKRLSVDLSSQNENKMRTFARTAINEAENKGRQRQMEDAAKMGIVQLKQWVATLDGRTRDVHRHLDGDEVPYDKPFKSDLGDIMFPCDPSARPENVYNCRCTMITIYPKYRKQQDDWRDSETVDGMSYQEWKEGAKKQIEKNEAIPATKADTKEINGNALFEDDRKWLLKNGKPGVGEVNELENPTSPDYEHELMIAREIIKLFGGDVEMLDQRGNNTVADYGWKGELWELKHPTSRTAADDRTHDATKKMKKIDCNVIIDVECDDIEEIANIVKRRIIRSAPKSCHVIMFHKGEYYGSWKYKKSGEV